MTHRLVEAVIWLFVDSSTLYVPTASHVMSPSQSIEDNHYASLGISVGKWYLDATHSFYISIGVVSVSTSSSLLRTLAISYESKSIDKYKTKSSVWFLYYHKYRYSSSKQTPVFHVLVRPRKDEIADGRVRPSRSGANQVKGGVMGKALQVRQPQHVW